ncbi:MAG: methylmalonyl Co-A mutase-associated GTPase MeaB [Rhodospirillales bacterium]|jgi:LAO/AO transport system kinase|nr:methylmalonyl Co-A mutase-associated GTPase MeaB [Rhodospirillaceae bacterium]MAF49870.1 methylmalonyl Co-A mutase-associated GTPase MeaB [Rhodospirillaceae bacterium]MDP6427947.1 methylmalonyl Co-A mutase-associated GTPase MeaB [Rhodospirillales bacterium]MDP6642987.1 methylmalonyl Co-A mutase-associated GTPase MeaB [Rhodospirillales bacterium]MDP6842463.1 methylmalonyl Co-A mutase-associated GTPase MeaB [Rhodospirillales bacterium]|tara:strand:- start:44 stop:1006 length:963 start_codon:yes stop_codon:yes gene_type:complete
MHETAKKVIAGEVRTASRLIRDIDDGNAEVWPVLKDLYAHRGNGYVVGITGSPGAGKSTIVDQLIYHLREEGKTLGVLSVDPSSPFTGGAILGDRIRMQRHATDKDVFIRSMATRGAFGGLSRSTKSSINVLDAMGKNYILVETVGVGQDEVDIVGCADTTIVVVPPGMGDDIQAIKAGVMEIADIYVVNKADLDGAEKAANYLTAMLELDSAKYSGDVWKPPVLMVEAVQNKGIPELLDAIKQHARFGPSFDQDYARNKALKKIRNELAEMIQTSLIEHCQAYIDNGSMMGKSVDAIANGDSDPYTESEKLIHRFLNSN